MDSMTYADLSWTVWHEGVRIFDSGNPGNYRNVNDVRKEALGCQNHNGGAQQRISALSNDQLSQLISQIPDEIIGPRDVGAHLQWVAYHEGRIADLRNYLADGNFVEVRSIYYSAQHHNPNTKNLLSGLSNGHLTNLINSL